MINFDEIKAQKVEGNVEIHGMVSTFTHYTIGYSMAVIDGRSFSVDEVLLFECRFKNLVFNEVYGDIVDENE